VALATAHAPPKLTESACLARLAAAPWCADPRVFAPPAFGV